MRVWQSPCNLIREDAERLCRILGRTADGTLTLRDLQRRYRFSSQAMEAAEAAGIVRIEKRQPHTGRPSFVAVIEPDAVNKNIAAKLPSRAERPLTISIREEAFLFRYICRWGCRLFPGDSGGSAEEAYREVYGRRGRLTAASARSAGARLRRQPWMVAGFYLDRRLMAHGGRLQWPDDLRSAAPQWSYLIRILNRLGDWPPRAAQIVRHAKTYGEAWDGLNALPLGYPRWS
jgi:hypothetical protein